ncbi:MAG: c-type cytochrome domain-containing protein [bacterium]
MKKYSIVSAFVALGGAFLAAGCPGFGDETGPLTSVPDLPLYATDMAPLLERYCNECHSVPPTQGAPGYLRLDECEDVDGVLGASAMAQRNAVRTFELKTMPPANYSFQPSNLEREVFQRWFDTGAPCDGTGTATNNMTTPTNNMTTPTNNMTTPTNNMTTVTGAPFSAVAGILSGGCSGGACHDNGNGGFTVTFNATQDQVRTALAGKNADSGTPFVVPNDPSASRLYQVMSSNRVGERMPPTGNLPEAQQEAIRTWILSGAPYQ